MGGHGSSRDGRAAPDPAAAKQALAIIKDGGLARGHRAGWSIQNQYCVFLATARIEPRPYRQLRRTEFGRDRQPRLGGRAEPVYLAKGQPGLGECGARTDDHTALLRIETQHVERLCRGDPEPFSLADREMCDAAMTAQHASRHVDYVPGLARFRPQALDEPHIGSLRYKADVLAIRFVGDRQIKAARQGAGLVFGESSQREAQKFKLCAGRREQEITLVAGGIGCPAELGSVRPDCPAHIMPCGECGSAEIACGPEQIAKLDPLIAPDARDRCLAAAIGLGEILDHFFAEPALVIEHIMRDAEAVGDAPGVADVLAGTTCTLMPDRGAVVVKLQRDADDLEAPLDQQSRSHRRIDAARHRDDDAVVGGLAGEVWFLEPRSRHFGSNCCISSTSASRKNSIVIRLLQHPNSLILSKNSIDPPSNVFSM